MWQIPRDVSEARTYASRGQSPSGADALDFSSAATEAKGRAASCEVAETPTVGGVAGQVDEGSETMYTIWDLMERAGYLVW